MNGIKKILQKTKSSKDLVKINSIGEPTGVNHHIHVTHVPNLGLTGLPPEWEEILKKNNIKFDK